MFCRFVARDLLHCQFYNLVFKSNVIFLVKKKSLNPVVQTTDIVCMAFRHWPKQGLPLITVAVTEGALNTLNKKTKWSLDAAGASGDI